MREFGVKSVFFENVELVVGGLHPDASCETHEAEGFDDGALLERAAAALVGAEFEAEGLRGETGPEVGGAKGDVLVQERDGGREAPELPDAVGEDAALDEGAGGGVRGGGVGEADDGEGGLESVSERGL